MRPLAMVMVFGRAPDSGGRVGVSLAGSAASSGALTSFFCFCLAFLGGVVRRDPISKSCEITQANNLNRRRRLSRKAQ